MALSIKDAALKETSKEASMARCMEAMELLQSSLHVRSTVLGGMHTLVANTEVRLPASLLCIVTTAPSLAECSYISSIRPGCKAMMMLCLSVHMACWCTQFQIANLQLTMAQQFGMPHLRAEALTHLLRTVEIRRAAFGVSKSASTRPVIAYVASCAYNNMCSAFTLPSAGGA